MSPRPEAERAEAVEMAVLLMLAKLTPAERAAYVLREAFDYPYEQIADVLHLGSANCRQLVRRARQRMVSERRRPVSVAARKRLVLVFLAAARGRLITDLEHLLVTDAVSRLARASSGELPGGPVGHALQEVQPPDRGPSNESP
jgi:RNA polymerase sigma-70 factor (ECF subfamily)